MLDVTITEISALLLSAMPTLTIRTGERFLSENTSAPRLVWVYAKSNPLKAPRKMTDPTTGLPISSCFTRNAGVDAHIWGISHAQAEAILHNVITAIHRTLHGSVSLADEQWPKSQGYLEHGTFCILPMVVHIPVLTSFITLPTAPPTVPEYPGGVPTGAQVIQGKVQDPSTGIFVDPPTPGTTPDPTTVPSQPTAPAKSDGTPMTYVTVVESEAGANEIVIEQEPDLDIES